VSVLNFGASIQACNRVAKKLRPEIPSEILEVLLLLLRGDVGLVVGEVGALGLKELLGDVFAQRFRDDLVELIDVLADWFARVGVVLDAVESGLDDRRQREVGVARQVRIPNLELREVPRLATPRLLLSVHHILRIYTKSQRYCGNKTRQDFLPYWTFVIC
jgi:hypothetical protein